MNKDTYVIVPAFNEEQVIGRVISELRPYFENIICINDGSTDATEKAIIASRAVSITHPINLGQGAALQTGIEYALKQTGAKYFVTFDADGQHSPKDAVNMLKVLKKEKCDIILGSRFLGVSNDIPFMKKSFLKLARIFSRVMTGINLTDTHMGLRVFNRNFAEKLNITMNGMSHATEIIDRLKQYDFKYKEVPVTVIYTEYSRAKGQSMLNSVNIITDIFIERLLK